MNDVVGFAKARLLFRSNQRLSRSDFERRRLHCGRAFAEFVRANSRCRKRIMEQGSIDPSRCVPDQFPVLKKSDLVRNFNDIVTDRSLTYQDVADFLHKSSPPEAVLRNRHVLIHASGSSGEIGFFLYDRRAPAKGLGTALKALAEKSAGR